MNIAIDSAVAAVTADSVITMFVGWRLNRTARRETAKAAETVKPALEDALSEIVARLLPVVIAEIGRRFPSQEDNNNANIGAIHPIDRTGS